MYYTLVYYDECRIILMNLYGDFTIARLRWFQCDIFNNSLIFFYSPILLLSYPSILLFCYSHVPCCSDGSASTQVPRHVLHLLPVPPPTPARWLAQGRALSIEDLGPHHIQNKHRFIRQNRSVKQGNWWRFYEGMGSIQCLWRGRK